MTTLIDFARFLRRVLQTVFVISLVGVLFSGTLTYREMRGTAAGCPSPGAAGTILGYPACVYGLIMYSALLIISGWALARRTPANNE